MPGMNPSIPQINNALVSLVRDGLIVAWLDTSGEITFAMSDKGYCPENADHLDAETVDLMLSREVV